MTNQGKNKSKIDEKPLKTSEIPIGSTGNRKRLFGQKKFNIGKKEPEIYLFDQKVAKTVFDKAGKMS